MKIPPSGHRRTVSVGFSRQTCTLNVITVLLVLSCWPDSSLAAPAADKPATALDPLCLAATEEISALRSILKGARAVPEHRCEHDYTALHLATIAGHVDAVAYLLELGTAVDAGGRYDMRPLHWAALGSQVQIVRLLLDAGAEVDGRNLYGMTPLHMAGSREVAELLLDRGADKNARDVRGMTPLHFARTEEVARVLLTRGADARARDRTGLAPLSMTGIDNCKDFGLALFPDREKVRMREAEAHLVLMLWNTQPRTLQGVHISADTALATVGFEPAAVEHGRLGQVGPGQMITVTLRFARPADGRAGKGRLDLRLTEAGDRPLALCDLAIDSRREVTPEDRGALPVGTVKIRPAPAWHQYAVFAALPLVALGAWLVMRRRG